MAFISYAQNAEDVLLQRALHIVGKGHYIDIGANHPIEDSVTKAFYDRGWSGVNVEPVEFWFNKLLIDRKRDLNLQIAISDSDKALDFFEVEETGLSTLDPDRADQCRQQGFNVISRSVECWTLAHLFRLIGAKETHFLKIDVEGAEAQVIRSGDWNRYRPWIVLVESTRPNTNDSDHQSWEPTLLASGYLFIWFDGINRYYLAQEHKHLSLHFQIPVNVLDHYVSYREVALAESRYQLILDMECRQEDFQKELGSAKEAISSAKGSHDNALAILKLQQKTLETQQTLLDWYHADPMIKSSIKLRKLPRSLKRRLVKHLHQMLNVTIHYLDHNPRLKLQLVVLLKKHPTIVKQLQRLAGRTLPRLETTCMGVNQSAKREGS